MTKGTTYYRRLSMSVLTALAAALSAATIVTYPAPADEPSRPATATTTTTERIEEDDPRWDCRTMGNRRCGPVGAGMSR
jgi:hypothetical protein